MCNFAGHRAGELHWQALNRAQGFHEATKDAHSVLTSFVFVSSPFLGLTATPSALFLFLFERPFFVSQRFGDGPALVIDS